MMMTALMASALLVTSGAGSSAEKAAGDEAGCGPADTEIDTARRVFQFAFPLYEVWRTRQRMLQLSGATTNSLLHRKTLSRPGDRSITTPNVDTLYSTAWLDLTDSPVRLTVPAMGARYHSIALMHPFSDVFAVLRNEDANAVEFLIVGPHWGGTADPHQSVIRSPTNDVWLVARTSVQGADDLPEAQQLQSTYALAGETRGDRDLADQIPARPNSTQLLAIASTVLARGPVPVDTADRIGCLGSAVTVQEGEKPGVTIGKAIGPALDRHLETFLDETKLAFERLGTLRNGWRYPLPHIARFGPDDAYRSAMALGGLAALPIEEAANPLTTRDADGADLIGTNSYRLHIPWDVPVDGFWSLTLYEADGSGRWFLYKNPSNRHAVTSLTGDLDRDESGTSSVHISHAPPRDGANWLPAPRGRFMLVFRAYRPRAAFMEGSFRLSPVERTAG